MKIGTLFIVLTISTGLCGQIALDRLTDQIDNLVQIGLDSMAYPGCQVVVMQKGEVILNKSYGFHTYDKSRAVEAHHIYDLASLTKVTTALPLLMYYNGLGLFDINASVADYLPKFRHSNKANLTWKEVLTHQAGLTPWLPHWQNTLKKNHPKRSLDSNNQIFKSRTFRRTSSSKYAIQVSDGLFLHKRYPKKMAKAIKKSALGEKEYLYSGILFYLMPEMITDLASQNFEDLLYHKIYDPIGADRLRYRPLDHFPMEDIVPTEYDSTFRNTLVHGIVHDEGAAMMNGISCNAGLFGNATDLAKLGNLYAQYGTVDGAEILKKPSVRLFGKTFFADTGNRRGLGFDKPLLAPDDNWIGPCGPSASPNSFGHSGFTGTYMWVDPDHELVFVFLSNRVHPTRTNRKLYSMNLRQLMHEACYDAMK